MSDFIIKGETLTNIANAIRAKSGSSATMTPEQMSTEIENISVGGGDIDALIEGNLTEITSNATSVKEYAFSKCTNLTSANFPNVTSVGQYAFAECSTLSTLNMPQVTSLGANAFRSCKALSSIDFPQITSLDNTYIFSSCEALVTVNLPKLTSIGNGCFASCKSLTNASYPNVETMGSSVFDNCQNLKTVYFPKITSISSGAFRDCHSLISVDIPNATSVNGYAFYNNKKLSNIYLSSVTTIDGSSSFGGCINLKNIDFPLLTTISGNTTFSTCSSLESVDFPNLTTIGNSCFSYCRKLKKLLLRSSTKATLSAGVFGGNTPIQNGTGYVYVPNNLVADYRVATNWATYASQIFPWVSTVEELATIDSTTYTRACVGTENNGTEYTYNGTSWEVVA